MGNQVESTFNRIPNLNNKEIISAPPPSSWISLFLLCLPFGHFLGLSVSMAFNLITHSMSVCSFDHS